MEVPQTAGDLDPVSCVPGQFAEPGNVGQVLLGVVEELVVADGDKLGPHRKTEIGVDVLLEAEDIAVLLLVKRVLFREHAEHPVEGLAGGRHQSGFLDQAHVTVGPVGGHRRTRVVVVEIVEGRIVGVEACIVARAAARMGIVGRAGGQGREAEIDDAFQ